MYRLLKATGFPITRFPSAEQTQEDETECVDIVESYIEENLNYNIIDLARARIHASISRWSRTTRGERRYR